MPANLFRGDYEQLAKIAQRFGHAHEAAQHMVADVQRHANLLQDGDWVGQGAQAFYAEMNGDVLPSLKRLVKALQSAQQTAAQISREIKQAEDEAAAVLKDTTGEIAASVNKSNAGDSGLLGQIGGFFGGLWEGAKGTVTGLWEAVTHPIDTAKGLYYGITHPDKLWEALKKPYVDDWQSGNYGRAIGRGTFEALMLLVPGVGEAKAVGKGAEVANAAGKLSKASELANAVSKGEKIAETANVASKAEKIAEVGNVAEKIEEGASAASKARVVAETSVETQRAFKALMGSQYETLAADVEAIKAVRPEFAHIPTSDLAAVRGYTGSDYSMLNTALRNKDAAELARLKPYIASVDAGLEKLPDFSGKVYRGSNLPPDVIAKYVPGQLIKEEAFFSTSTLEANAFFGNTRYIIQSTSGKDVSLLSQFASEQEILFKSGTRFMTLANETDAVTGITTLLLREVL